MPRTTTTGGTLTNMWRSVDDKGDALEIESDGLYKLIEPDPNDYVTPPKGVRAKLRISGISETFLMPSYNDPEIKEDKVKVEFQIVTLKGNNLEWMQGKRFTQMFTDKVSPKSALGLLFAALSDKPIPMNADGYPYDGYIGTELISLIGANDAGTYARINPEAIETAKTVLSPAVKAYFGSNGATPEPALVGEAVGAGEAKDPFETVPEDEDGL